MFPEGREPSPLAEWSSQSSESSLDPLQGLNTLHIAAQDGNIQQCRKLLKQGADVNARTEDIYESTALMLAVVAESATVVKLLLKHHADANIHSFGGSTALHKAVQLGSQEIAQLLLANGADVNAKGYNANIRWREGYLEPDTGPTALHEAAEDCDAAMVQLLLEHGANIKARTKHGKTPLHSLIESVRCEDNADIAKLMLEHHASVRMIDREGNTPLLLAVRRNQPKIVAVLLSSRSPNIKATDKEGRGVLHIAAVYSNKAMARLLLDHGADINADSGETMFGGSPLDEALSHRKRGIVDLLRSRGGLRRNQLQA